MLSMISPFHIRNTYSDGEVQETFQVPHSPHQESTIINEYRKVLYSCQIYIFDLEMSVYDIVAEQPLSRVFPIDFGHLKYIAQ